jgi:hypothetical protein
MINNMLAAGNASFGAWIDHISRVALTKSTALEVLEEFDEAIEKETANGEEDAPKSL